MYVGDCQAHQPTGHQYYKPWLERTGEGEREGLWVSDDDGGIHDGSYAFLSSGR